MNDLPWFALIALLLALVVGTVHSRYVSYYELDSLYADDPNCAAKRRILKVVWHVPSLIWVATASAILFARSSETTSLALSALAIFSFSLAGLGNFWARRRLFIGNILLLFIAGLIAMDWLENLT